MYFEIDEIGLDLSEVRPAPHMDNLVSIYKSMEVASGINIFVTQNAPSTKLSDRVKQAEGDENHGEQITGGNCQDRSEKQNTLKVKGSRKTSKSNMKNTSSISLKPSFPTKKRVQVPQCPLSETPTRLSKFEGQLSEIGKEDPKINSTTLKEKPALNDRGEPMLSPFFWLREEEDAEKSTQETDEGELMDVPQIDVPSFSDIKDSDDENPSNLTPTGGLHGKCSTASEFFDSEMFEWTQRPCSPELCSSPFKTQVANVEEMTGNQENELDVALQGVTADEEQNTENAKCMNSKQGSVTADVLSNVSSPRPKGSSDQNESNKSNKSRGIGKASERGQKKCAKKHTDSDFRIYVDLNKASENFIQEQTCYNNDSLNLDETRKRSKKTCFGTSATKATPKNVHAVSVGTETLNHGEGSMVTKTPASLGKKEGHEDFTLENSGKRRKKIDCLVRSEKRKLDSVKDNMHEEISKIDNNKNEHTIPELAPLPIPRPDDKKASNFRQKPRKLGKETNSCDREQRSKKKMKVSSDHILKDDLVNDIQEGHAYVPAKETQLNEKIQCNPDVKAQDDSSVVQKLPSQINKIILRKCETVSNKFQCAFCLSSEESEAAGEMVHYYNGKSVAADHNGGSKVIHSHRNCTEWITLSCYALFMPLLSFPVKALNLNLKERKKCTPKGQLSRRDHVASKNDAMTGRNWNFCGSPKKLFLCCSALTTPERETVSKFERLSGVTVLKKWDSTVTHVISSTDENGACRRTLKVLMGILEGKWILSMEWIKACMKVMQLVDEEPYEITVDIHGIRDGPQLGRLRLLNQQPKLFDGCKFYFMGDFTTAYKGYLQDLVIAAGGTILHRKPISEAQKAMSSGSSTCQTFIIYSLELPDKCDISQKPTIFNRRRSDAEALATSTGAKVASNSWVLNSIAACNLQNLAE
uniref:BRCT domain-containing protein n=1 Tax=Fagus sylvatica TaxID=28930 RepID=A0A2N9G1B9_FAGSY